MPTKYSKAINFKGQRFFIGIDVHKKSWAVTIRSLNLEVSHFTQQPPGVLHLSRYLNTHFPEGQYYSAYEAGFCGTCYHEQLCSCGIKNIIIHPADLPQTDKQKKTKTDIHDSRAIARFLEAGLLSGIHILTAQQQQRRALFRYRQTLVKDVTRTINRLKGLIYYLGIELPQLFRDKAYVSKAFLSWIDHIKLPTPEGSEVLQQYVQDLTYQRQQLLMVTRKLKKSVQQYYGDTYTSLLTVPGFGPITSIGLLAEIGELSRFGNPDEYVSYLGVIPAEKSSGETVHAVYLQPRCNTHLRPLLVEAAWKAICCDDGLRLYYRKHAGTNPKKAIVKVARKLALIAKAVALKKIPYHPGYTNKLAPGCLVF